MDIDSPSNICTVYDTFDFSKFILTHPESLPGGSFFTKLNINNDVLYLQTPKCISKQGVVSSSGKKSYIDLMFSSDDSKFIEFMENLEKSCVEKIHEKRNSWFTNDIDQNDIENAFTATLRPYKAGKYYLLRANIAPSKNLVKMPTCFVFDESENKLSLEDIKPENDLITVLEIQGIKFTSKSFQFEIIIRQALIMANKPVFQSCLIRKNISIPSTVSLTTESQREQSTIELTGDENENDNENENENENEKIQPRIENNLEKIKKAKSKVVLNLEPNDDTDNDDTCNDDTKNDDTSHESKQNTHQDSDVDGCKVPLVTGLTGLTGLTELTDLDLEIKNDNDNIKLKKPNDIYYEIYIAAKEKARTARKLAFDAYLEVKKIKKTYMLDDSDSDFSNSSGSDDSDDSNDSGESDHSDGSEKTDV